MMDWMLKIIGLCLVTAVISSLLRKEEPTYALLLAVATVLLGAALIFSGASEVVGLTDELIALSGLSPTLFVPLFKVTAVALLSHISASLCADAGQSALGRLTETAGAFCSVGCALPLLRAVIDLIKVWL